MPGYSGNGYFLKVLQRGAAPVGASRARPTRGPVEVEETVTTGGGEQVPEVPVQTFAAQYESPDYGVTTSPQLTQNDPLVEPRSVDPVLPTSFDSHETAIPAVTTSSINETPDREATPISLSSERSPEPPVEPALHKSSTPPENPHVSYSPKRVFELRMPEDFYVPATRERSRVSPPAQTVLQSRIVSPDDDPQAESEPVVEQSFDVSPAKVHAEAKTQLEVRAERQSRLKSAIVPQRSGESPELQIVELSQPGSTTESHVTPHSPNAANEIVSQVMHYDAQPSRLIAAEAFESPTPTPRAQQVSDYPALQQPSIAPAAIAPPARLQINRLDIQVINQAAAPPPPQPAHAPDVSQLFEKKHLGRVELLL